MVSPTYKTWLHDTIHEIVCADTAMASACYQHFQEQQGMRVDMLSHNLSEPLNSKLTVG